MWKSAFSTSYGCMRFKKLHMEYIDIYSILCSSTGRTNYYLPVRNQLPQLIAPMHRKQSFVSKQHPVPVLRRNYSLMTHSRLKMSIGWLETQIHSNHYWPNMNVTSINTTKNNEIVGQLHSDVETTISQLLNFRTLYQDLTKNKPHSRWRCPYSLPPQETLPPKGDTNLEDVKWRSGYGH